MDIKKLDKNSYEIEIDNKVLSTRLMNEAKKAKEKI